MNNKLLKPFLIAEMSFCAFKERSVNKCYDRFASHYDLLFGELQSAAAEVLKSYMLESGLTARKALDLGCGTGIMTSRLADIADYIVGTDFSEKMLLIAKAKHNGEKYDFIQRNILYPCEIKGRFDLITALGIIPHIPHVLAEKWFEEIKTLLEPQGHLILGISPAPWRWFSHAKPICDFSFVDIIFVTIYNAIMKAFKIEAQCWYWKPNMLERILERQGFRVKSFIRDNILIVDAVVQ
jgi:ubiquinone/menaquinone biosynthesis C-methylase UbiE